MKQYSGRKITPPGQVCWFVGVINCDRSLKKGRFEGQRPLVHFANGVDQNTEPDAAIPQPVKPTPFKLPRAQALMKKML
jgi:hypothetical protein